VNPPAAQAEHPAIEQGFMAFSLVFTQERALGSQNDELLVTAFNFWKNNEA
jgi:hypothetical protein